jgi:hypothetical protein
MNISIKSFMYILSRTYIMWSRIYKFINSQYINIKPVQQWATSSTSWLLFVFGLQQVYRHLSGLVWSKGFWSVWSVSCWAWRCVILNCIVLRVALWYTALYRVEWGAVLYWIVSCWAGRCVILNCIVLIGGRGFIECNRVGGGAVLYWV